MDALALLCTLHADGPTSLKRLRARGCANIGALVARTADDLADDLEVERAVARRLLREARILVDRIGPGALEPEEAPPAVGRVGLDQAPPLAAVPTAPAQTELDAMDRALVARISRPEPAPEPEPEPQPDTEPETPPEPHGEEAAQEQPVQEPVEEPVEEPIEEAAEEPVEQVQLHPARPARTELAFGAAVFAEPITPHAPIEDDALLAAETFLAEAAPLVTEDVLDEPLDDSAAPERDAARVSDDAAAEEVAPATEILDDVEPTAAVEPPLPGTITAGRLTGLDEALVEDLQRLGIHTYDELSGVESLELTRGLGITFAQARRLRFLARRAAIEVMEQPIALQPAPIDLDPAASKPIEGQVHGTPPLGVVHEISDTPDDASDESEQGVRVDPSEIEARPRFGDQFARAVAERKLDAPKATGRTVLGWNFEIPRPEADALPYASISAPGPQDDSPSDGPGTGEAVETDAPRSTGSGEDTAGPFAHA